MDNTIQLTYTNNWGKEVEGYPLTSPDRVIDEKGKSVKEHFNLMEVQKVDKRVVDRLEERVNALSRLGEGSTTGDAELIDGRIDANGLIHRNIGEAIRHVGSSINEVIITGKNIFDKNSVVRGYYYHNNSKIENSNLCYYKILITGTKYFINKKNVYVQFHRGNDEYISSVVTTTPQGVSIPTNAIYMYVSCYLSDLDTIQVEVGENETEYENFKRMVKDADYINGDYFNKELEKHLGDAKIDFFGKEHFNLEDRLNVDFDNVHQRINDSNYIEYTDSNIKADNTYHGLTKEINIKGRTLQNLVISASVASSHSTTYYFKNKSHEQFLKPNTKYTMILYPSSPKINQVYLAQGATVRLNLDSKNMALFTTQEDISSITGHIHFYTNGDATLDEVKDTKIVLLEGDYTNIDFIIPYFEGIKSVGENDVTKEGKYPIKIKSCGKNLFKMQLKEGFDCGISFRPTPNNTMLLNGTHNAPVDIYFQDYDSYILLKKGKTYTIKAFIISGHSNKLPHLAITTTDLNKNNPSWIDNTNGEIVLKNLAQDTLLGKIRLHHSRTPVTTYTDCEIMIQVVEGESGELVKYQESVQEILLDEPLRSLPNNIYDEILEDGTEIRRIGKMILEGNPIVIYYELKEPIIIKHNKNMNLKTFDETTHIASTNTLPATIHCKVPSNVQAVVSNLMTENKALNAQVSTLNLENEEIKETNTIQDGLIDTTMMATDEMFMMLEPLLAETLSERSTSKIVDMYVAMVQRGIKTIEQVPVRYREQVKKILDQLEK